MDEPSSDSTKGSINDDDDFIDEILSSIAKEKTIRIEPVDSRPKKDSFDLLDSVDVLLEDGLLISDVINEEIVMLDENDGTLNTGNESDCMPTVTAANSDNIEELVFLDVNDGMLNSKSDYRPTVTAANSELMDEGLDDCNDPDFVLSENDSSDTSVKSAINNNTLNDITNDNSDCDDIPTRKRRKRPDNSAWDVSLHKKLRMTGKKYVGYKKVRKNGKIIVQRSENEREERKMGPACVSKVCKANKKRKCTEFSEEDRRKMFNNFWPMSWKEKIVYITDHVKKCETNSKTVEDENKKSRRSNSYKYYLNNESEFKSVCKTMFLNTFGLNEWMVHNWIKNNGGEGYSEDYVENTNKKEENVQPENSIRLVNGKDAQSKEISEKKKVLSDWLDSLPKVPSHYCRASSFKLYLEPIWESNQALYRKYKEFCTINNRPCGSITTFMEVFKEKNLSVFSPRKDQCDTCYAFKAGNILKEVYERHIIEKDEARKEKERDKELALKGEIYCLTADVQAVKLTPMTKASSMYYKTKLCSHNYTVYNLASKHCKCYWFSEVEGDLSANTFASCLWAYLEEHCCNPLLPIIVYTDGCTNQNRNQFVSNALLHFSVTKGVEITQKYLVKGHTQMEGDSVHSKIEQKIRGKDIFMPYEYVKFTKEARHTPFPYEAVYLKHTFFKDFSKIVYYDSIRPGRKKGDPCVVDVRCLKYTEIGKIKYKLAFVDEFTDLPRRANKIQQQIEPTPLFKERIKIPFSKWKHLQDLKLVIPEDYHSFYDSLPYQM
ncbi:uncharacterized protein LOC111052339 isoform X2 [Nilaparvata lugens]|uniref:uncharacterized protein LOC111052339 isoform X2 n=1 Tax=Nilaparvata lugens TaxID=108931 RepID=UPI00193EB58E|nr:uncharacterized protein LOC111052339 isoform X2 [Nilaparvata lugens]